MQASKEMERMEKKIIYSQWNIYVPSCDPGKSKKNIIRTHSREHHKSDNLIKSGLTD